MSSISLTSQCLPMNNGSGSWRGTSKNSGFRVNWGVRYCANRILGSTGPLIVPVLADLRIHILLELKTLRSSCPFWLAKKTKTMLIYEQDWSARKFRKWRSIVLTSNTMPSADWTRAAVALSWHGHGHKWSYTFWTRIVAVLVFRAASESGYGAGVSRH